jgi:pyruvate dehydrogenase E2 component (dihydrolipoamide acetyltransferase)
MPELLLVPEVAAGATEVVIADWLVQPGTDYTAGDAIAVIETEKAVVEMEAPQGGTLLKALVEPGTTIEVGRPMALVGSSSDVGTDLDAALAALGHGAPPAATPAPPPAPPAAAPPARVFASPLVRKLLREAGLTTDGLVGTGPRGRIRKRDVEGLIAASRAAEVPAVEPAPASAAQVDGPWTDVPHSRLRRAIARRLTESKQDVPHFYVRRSVTLDPLLDLRTQLVESTGTKVSVNDFLVRAIAAAHQQVPDANVIWTDEAMRRFDHVDIAVAIASERGLVTPVLRHVETSSLSAISRQVKAFVEQANAGTLQQRDLEGGSITLSNLGMHGVDEFSAIINPPQSAILAVGAGRPTAVVEDGQVVVRTVAEVVLSADHRAIDGALAAQWMGALVEALHRPLSLLV